MAADFANTCLTRVTRTWVTGGIASSLDTGLVFGTFAGVSTASTRGTLVVTIVYNTSTVGTGQAGEAPVHQAFVVAWDPAVRAHFTAGACGLAFGVLWWCGSEFFGYHTDTQLTTNAGIAGTV